jgi:hypothetical protein
MEIFLFCVTVRLLGKVMKVTSPCCNVILSPQETKETIFSDILVPLTRLELVSSHF